MRIIQIMLIMRIMLLRRWWSSSAVKLPVNWSLIRECAPKLSFKLCYLGMKQKSIWKYNHNNLPLSVFLHQIELVWDLQNMARLHMIVINIEYIGWPAIMMILFSKECQNIVLWLERWDWVLFKCSLCFGESRQMVDGSRHVVVNVLSTIWKLLLHIIRHVMVHLVRIWKPEHRGRWTSGRCPSRTTPAPPWSASTAPPVTAPIPLPPCLPFYYELYVTL